MNYRDKDKMYSENENFLVHTIDIYLLQGIL